jgi:auxin responsive GH3 gene family
MTVMIEASTTNVVLWDLSAAALVKDADAKKLWFIEEMTSKVDVM